MLRLKDVVKTYRVADTDVYALKGISISFRKNEFVSILGPSGCGKTTTLNIIGGLDHYTNGDLFINGVSTKKFGSHDWDVYRNHRVGFIFQSYNLIPHQTILENVELALTIAGVDKQTRIEKSKAILDKVGLKGQYNKKPNQLSGGQCQRVAIARALVNDPEILLADEPTGALDTQTSVQIMELIKEIAKERLVIMVTHNPELAEKYSSRIIRLLDGEVQDDSNPFTEEEEIEECKQLEANENKEEKKKTEKAKMSLWTSFKLSQRNLRSKFKRTLMVCLAGSIGIIGVSTVLGVSSGVKGYIKGMQDDMLSGNPVQISETGFDLARITSMMTQAQKNEAIKKNTKDGYVDVNSLVNYILQMKDMQSAMVVENDITKEYVQFVNEMPKEFYSDIKLDYGIDFTNNIYTDFQAIKKNDETKTTLSVSALVQTYTSVLEETEFKTYASYLTSLETPFAQANNNDEYILNQYDVLATKKEEGESPIAKKENEIMVVVSKDTKLNDVLLAELGYYTEDEFLNTIFKETDKKADKSKFDENLYKEREDGFTYEELLNKKFYYYSNDSIYKEIDNPASMTPYEYVPYEKDLNKEERMTLDVVTILRPKKDVSYGCLKTGIYYSKALTDKMLKEAKESSVVKGIEKYNEKLATLSKMNPETSGTLTQLISDGYKGIITNGVAVGGIQYSYDYWYVDSESLDKMSFLKKENVVGMVGSRQDMSALSAMLGESGSKLFENLPTTYSLSRRALGGNDLPNDISVYPVNFKIKDKVTTYLDKWNNNNETIELGGENKITLTPEKRNDISYTDNLEIVINMIGSMIDIITYALVAFTAISLLVSTVMIGIITYVSVVERIKEIGVIRSLGGRKGDVASLFIAETFIIGLFSGILGIAITYGLSGIINLIIGGLTGIYTIASLRWYQALIMICISIFLTLISGLMPASNASKKDPVVALRTE